MLEFLTLCVCRITEKCVAQDTIMPMKSLYNMVKSYRSRYNGLIDLMLFAVQSNQNVVCLLLELEVFEIEVFIMS